MHHIVCDGYSMAILSDEIVAIYGAYARGEPSPLPDLTAQYADFAVWQREWLRDDRLEEQLRYWRAQLDGIAPLALPADHPRPTLQSVTGARVPLHVERSVERRLHELARAEKATPFMVLLASFMALLHRYTGQDDIVVGVPVANRGYANTERIIGHFVNTLPLRAKMSGDPRFLDFLRHVREAAIEAYAHQDVPFERLVEELRPPRDLSRHPVFQVTFQYAQLDGADYESVVAAVTDPLIQLGTAKFDLRCDVCNGADGLYGYIEYNTSLFERSTAARIATHLQTLITAIADDPDRTLSALPILTAQERETILVHWNSTATSYPQDEPIHRLFEKQAAAAPLATAIRDGSRSVTYADLNRQADVLAHTLRQHGLQLEDRVALYVERSPEMIVAMLAVLKAGGAYAPLDTRDPRQRLSWIIGDLSPRIIVSSKSVAKGLPEVSVPVVYVDDTAGADVADGHDAILEIGGDNLAYIIYTSGSSGRPKGVMIEHRAIARLVVNTDYISLTPSDRVAQAASCAFDAATFEIWGALLTGATLTMVPTEALLSADALAERLEDDGITVLFLTTELVHRLVDTRPDVFRNLDTLLFGGSVVDASRVRRLLLAHGRPRRVLHVYGPTECTTFATWHEVIDVAHEALSIPIGRPIANTAAFILDAAGNAVPPGVVGELHLGGPGLARGYFKQDALTHERFVERQIPGLPRMRLYRTGDCARYGPQGAIEFLGRFDRQVKVRGFRIELDEVELALASSDRVRACVALVRQYDGDSRLVAYVVPRERDDPELVSELRTFLQARLPPYMMPAHIISIRELPLNRSGKIDTAALPLPDDAAGIGEHGPLTDTEREIATIWAQVLQRERIGVDENFFDVGGHSLLLVEMQARLQRALGRKLPIVDLFRYPTVRALARSIANPDPMVQIPDARVTAAVASTRGVPS
jgi:amino acid adenylation domain-containing protein